jgi:hypothetical protein
MRATGRDVDRLREQLVILAIECPYTKSNPSTCPLRGVRKLKPTAIIDWLDALSSDEKDFLTQYHQCCLMTRWGRGQIERIRRRKRPAPASPGPRKVRGKARRPAVR